MSDNAKAPLGKSREGRAMGFKALLVGLILLVLGGAALLIKGVVDERSAKMGEATEDVSGKAGGPVLLLPPLLAVPVSYDEREGKASVRRSTTLFLSPSRLEAAAESRKGLRRRGIFEVPVFSCDVVMDCDWETGSGAAELQAYPGALVHWDWASAVFDPFNPRILASSPELAPDGEEGRQMRLTQIETESGGRFLGSPLPLRDSGGGARKASARLTLHLAGAKSLSLVPIGDASRFVLKGDWRAPSFAGNRLPVERSVGKGGFTASWFADETARPFPRFCPLADISRARLAEASFETDFILPVDVYQLSYRALRYALLFLLLPFAALFLFEILAKRRIHPIQYLMVGLADCLFYLLLLSLSEHLPFAAAYLSAAAAVTLLIAVYLSSVLGQRRRGLAVVPLLGAQYAYLYVALMSEDYALLIGATGLFLILAAVMLATRRIDWYAASSGSTKGEERPIQGT